MTAVPVWRTSLASVAVILAHWRVWVRLSWPVLVPFAAFQIVVALISLPALEALIEKLAEIVAQLERIQHGYLTEEAFLAANPGLTEQSNLMTLLNLLGLILRIGRLAMLLVRWCRFAALGDDASGQRVPFRFAALELEMLGAIILLVVGFGIIWVLAFALSPGAVVAIGGAGYAVMFVIYVASFVLMARFLILLPHVACDGGIDPYAVWRRTLGNTWRIFATSLNVGIAAFVVLCVATALVGGAIYLSRTSARARQWRTRRLR